MAITLTTFRALNNKTLADIDHILSALIHVGDLTRAQIPTTEIDAYVDWIRTTGYSAVGDGGGALYARVGSEPAHDLKAQSKDGAWWELVPDAAGIHIDQCGAVGDGSTDDNAAFEGWRSYIIQKLGDGSKGPDELVTLRLGRGKHYTYTNSRWLYGLPRWRVLGNGASLENISTSATSVNSRPFDFHFWFTDRNGTASSGSENWVFGDEVTTSLAGQAVVNMVTASHAGNFATGDFVLVGGFANMGQGQPPDYRYFEVREVASVDSGAGTVTLTENLRHSYYSTWPVVYTDSPSGEDIGPARLLKLNRSTHVLTHYAEMADVTIVKNRNQPSLAHFQVDSALHFVLRNVDATDCVDTLFSCAKLIECHQCKFSAVEGDKLVDRLVWHDCEADGNVAGFVGVTEFEANRGTIRAGTLSLGGRVSLLNGVTLDNPTAYSTGALVKVNHSETRLVERLELNNVRIYGNDRQIWDRDASGQTKIVGLTFSSLGTSNELLFSNAATWTDYNTVYPGARMMSADGTYLCEVTNIVTYDASNHAIEVDWLTAVPTPPVTLYHAINRDLLIRGGNGMAGWQREGDLVRIAFTDKDVYWYSGARREDLYGTVSVIRVHVEKAASGSGPTVIRFRDYSASATILDVDARTVGYYEATPAGIQTSPSGSTNAHSVANWNQVIDVLQIGPWDGTSAFALSGTESENPRLSVELIARAMV